MSNLVTEFADWLFKEGRATKTIESYVTDVKGFQKYLDEKVADDNQLLSRFLFVKYKEHLMNEGFAISTINKKVNSLKVYNDFLQSKGLVNDSFIEIKRDQVKVAAGSERQIDVFSDKEIEQLLFYIEDSTKVSVRNKLIVYLLLYTGVRVSELITIKRSDLDLLSQTMIVRGKGGKVREISLRTDLVEVINEYVKDERLQSRFNQSEYLLVSQRSKRMHRDAVRDMLARLSGQLGYRIYPHKFRRMFATSLIRAGVSITTIATLTGHSSVQVLEKHYISTSRLDKLRAVELL